MKTKIKTSEQNKSLKNSYGVKWTWWTGKSARRAVLTRCIYNNYIVLDNE